MTDESEALKSSVDIADRLVILAGAAECWRVTATMREVLADIKTLADSEDEAVVYTVEGVLATILHCLTYFELDTDDDEIARNRAILDELLDNPDKHHENGEH